MLIAMAMDLMDSTIVVALLVIEDCLNASPAQLQWISAVSTR
ncbi:hypothetical protein AB0I53_16485 [Saccharopolyspora sp. NPDC050389]